MLKSYPYREQSNLLTVSGLVQLGKEDSTIHLSTDHIQKVSQARQFLVEQLLVGKWVYGANSGFGPLANEAIHPDQALQHQAHLLYHLATGVGQPLPLEIARSVWALRLHQLAQGHSGISPQTLTELVNLFNAHVLPLVPCLGSVGASGDLTPLAHLALSLSGEGEFYFNDQKFTGKEWFIQQEVKPIQWKEKEALSFVNGTACMTAIAAHNHSLASKALHLSMLFAFMFGETQSAYQEAWLPLLSSVKKHDGQRAVAEQLTTWAEDSDWMTPVGRHEGDEEKYRKMQRSNVSGKGSQFFKNKEFLQKLPQDPYTLRCVPQLLGAVWDQLTHHNMVVEREIRSASDNPTVFAEEGHIFHGGNFNGQHISFVSDMLTQMVVYLGVYAERRIARLTDPSLNLGLPAFLVRRELGLNSGFMGAQVTSSSLVAHLRSLATPLSIQSIPTNANNQDIVSMGTLAAWRCYECLGWLYKILAIEAMMLGEAVDIRREQMPHKEFSSKTRLWMEELRTQFEILDVDRPLAKEVDQVANWLTSIVM